jgi:formate hydrogenlyase subunit 6/NADH:ubiquinone oxidoreductase subunit I
MEYGLGGIMQPVMKFDDGYCNYDCNLCSQICPAGAIKPLTVEQKHSTQPGRVVFNKDICVVNVNRTSCGACAEHCPVQAIHMVPFEGGLTIPETTPDLCVGCGGCEFICPVKAVHIEGNPIHLVAKAPEQDTNIQTEDFDFGF